ncbi:MAG: TolC family outer membrane protein [Methylococcales bacterium]
MKYLNTTILLIVFSASANGMDLTQTYALALLNDPTLKAARAQRDAVREVKPQAVAQLLPLLSVQGSGNYVESRTANNSGIQSQFLASRNENYREGGFSVNLNQPVFHWDYWARLFQTDYEIGQAEAQYKTAEQELMVRVAQAYFGVLTAQDDLEFKTAEKIAIGRQLEQAQQRFDVGLIAITDVYEAQAGYDQARSEEISAQNEVDNAKERLREIIGEQAVELAILAKDIPLKPPTPSDINGWSTAAQKQNYEVIAAQNNVKIAHGNVDIQQSGHYPTLDIVGSYGINESESEVGLSRENGTVGLQLNVPLFEGGGVLSRTRQAAHSYTQAQDELVKTRRAVSRQVKDAYRGVISTIARVKALKAAVKSSESSVEATEAGFEVGTRTMVDVLNVQRDLFRAKSAYANSRYDYILNGFLLKQASSIMSGDDLSNVSQWLE